MGHYFLPVRSQQNLLEFRVFKKSNLAFWYFPFTLPSASSLEHGQDAWGFSSHLTRLSTKAMFSGKQWKLGGVWDWVTFTA